MIIYVGMHRVGSGKYGNAGKRIKFTSDRDCLPADLIKFNTTRFDSYEQVLATAEWYWGRGYQVCVDTERGLVEYEH